MTVRNIPLKELFHSFFIQSYSETDPINNIRSIHFAPVFPIISLLICYFAVCDSNPVTRPIRTSIATCSSKEIHFYCRESNYLMPNLLLLFSTANNWISDVNSCNLQKYVFFQIVKGDHN